MRKINLYILASPIHDENTVNELIRDFIGGLNLDFNIKGNNFDSYGNEGLDIIYIATGGTEELFVNQYDKIVASGNKVYLLSSCNSNSLAASMEILSYLRKRKIEGEIIHGGNQTIKNYILKLADDIILSRPLNDCRLGIVGKPSDWLISSEVDYKVVRDKLGVELVDISLNEIIDAISSNDISLNSTEYKDVFATFNDVSFTKDCCKCKQITESLDGAIKIYLALKQLIAKYSLDGLTIRCFDLLSSVQNTGCLALSKLNSEGIVAGCEGDIPSALSMLIAKKIFGKTGFQANPSKIDLEKGEILFAHCTIPISMVDDFQLDTHFESRIGIGIRGFLHNQDITIFKYDGNDRYFAQEGKIILCGEDSNLCRTQLLIKMDDKNQLRYFMSNPIGNHHIILLGHIKDLIDSFFNSFAYLDRI